MTLFINSTYNEYVFQMNLLLVGGVFLANYLVLHYELEQLNFLLFSKPFLVLGKREKESYKTDQL